MCVQMSDDFFCSITVSHLGWRWVFWVMMMFAGFCTLLGAAFLPETCEPVLLAQKVRHLLVSRTRG
jgi:DHA1 family multidrug resistance protein-like MFS transporter